MFEKLVVFQVVAFGIAARTFPVAKFSFQSLENYLLDSTLRPVAPLDQRFEGLPEKLLKCLGPPPTRARVRQGPSPDRGCPRDFQTAAQRLARVRLRPAKALPSGPRRAHPPLQRLR